MPPDPCTVAPELRDALKSVMADPLRARVYFALFGSPGATIAQLADQMGLPARAVRHQIEQLAEAGLVAVDAETPRRNTRERHYRALTIPSLIEAGEDEALTETERRDIAVAIIKQILADLGAAVGAGGFASRPGHSEVRVVGEVDGRGWSELAAIMARTTGEIEAVLVESAARLEAAGETGFGATAAMLLFEGGGGAEEEGVRHGPRPSPWLARAIAERSEVDSDSSVNLPDQAARPV
jgi:DNA-binding transcriptional ArsR family regulator